MNVVPNAGTHVELEMPSELRLLPRSATCRAITPTAIDGRGIGFLPFWLPLHLSLILSEIREQYRIPLIVLLDQTSLGLSYEWGSLGRHSRDSHLLAMFDHFIPATRCCYPQDPCPIVWAGGSLCRH